MYPEIRDAYIETQGAVTVRARENIAEAIMHGDLKASTWWLARKAKDLAQPLQPMAVTGLGGGAIPIRIVRDSEPIIIEGRLVTPEPDHEFPQLESEYEDDLNDGS